MGTVRFIFPDGSEVDVDAYDQLNLLAHAQIAERSLQSRCGGHCECGTCRVILKEGRLSRMRDEEKALLEFVGAIKDPRVRLSCQSFPEKDCELVVLEVPGERFVDARGKRKQAQTRTE